MRGDVELRTGRGWACGVGDLADGQLRRLLEDPDGLLWRHLDRPVKIDHDSLMVQAQLPLDRGPVPVAYKRYRPRNWWKSFCSLFRRSRARRAWRLGHALLARRISTARPLAVCEPRRPPVSGTCFLATEWIESAENLHLAGWQWKSRPGPERHRWAARCAESLGRLLGRLHALKFAHRDLKAANLLVVEDGPSVATYLIDLDGLRPRRRLSSRRRASNLARLAVGLHAHPWVSRTICCRFLRTYALQFPPGTINCKPLWHAVAAHTRRLTARQLRRGEQIL